MGIVEWFSMLCVIALIGYWGSHYLRTTMGRIAIVLLVSGFILLAIDQWTLYFSPTVSKWVNGTYLVFLGIYTLVALMRTKQKTTDKNRPFSTIR